METTERGAAYALAQQRLSRTATLLQNAGAELAGLRQTTGPTRARRLRGLLSDLAYSADLLGRMQEALRSVGAEWLSPMHGEVLHDLAQQQQQLLQIYSRAAALLRVMLGAEAMALGIGAEVVLLAERELTEEGRLKEEGPAAGPVAEPIPFRDPRQLRIPCGEE